jgi:hypothetical protein
MPRILGCVALLVCSCVCSKSDADRAREEREAIKQRMAKSLVLWPYPLAKMAFRARQSPGRPAAIDRLVEILDELKALPDQPRRSKR